MSHTPHAAFLSFSILNGRCERSEAATYTRNVTVLPSFSSSSSGAQTRSRLTSHTEMRCEVTTFTTVNTEHFSRSIQSQDVKRLLL